MDWRWALFSFEGRLPRAPFWIILAAYLIGLPFVSVMLKRLSFLGPALALALDIAFYPAIIWIAFAVAAKRLHDRGKSASWLLLYALAPMLLGQIATGMTGIPTHGHSAILLSYMRWVLALWSSIELVILPGIRGPNRFGPEPGL
ncbi:DUF805 domain-containing protein [Kaistia algarum]|uniref:DUF805 domain-containing protein n=1 Tax=Kaistia algarum TaxID=2083279 RepID=UPI001402EDA4|nr:DUF805 domain-containing protein [Kaistia algarum]MCX5516620.1 DUF805 domain-containing protein [Kaistia algarum]